MLLNLPTPEVREPNQLRVSLEPKTFRSVSKRVTDYTCNLMMTMHDVTGEIYVMKMHDVTGG